MFKHVALPLHHKLIQFIGMPSEKWKSSYDKGRKYNSDYESTFLWLKKASDRSEDAYCKLRHATIIPRHMTDSNLMNHEKNEKHQKRVPSTGQTAFKVVKTSSGKSDALKVAEFQIAVSITCHSVVRFVGHLGEITVTHGEGSNLNSCYLTIWLFFTRFGFF